MPRRQPPKGYITASRAKRILGATDGMLRSYVLKGDIRHVVPEGRTHGFYLREDVEKVAERLNAFFAPENNSPEFVTATSHDLAAIVQISTAIFGGGGTPQEARQKWMEKNPEIFYVVKSPKRDVLGYASILPLRAEKIAKIMSEQEQPKDITSEDIQEFRPGSICDIYLAALCVKPGLADVEERRRGFQLITGLMQKLIDLGNKGVVIENIYARSRLVDGIRTLFRMGFTEIESTAPSKQRHFVIRLKESGLPFILQYKEALRQTQNKQGETQ